MLGDDNNSSENYDDYDFYGRPPFDDDIYHSSDSDDVIFSFENLHIADDLIRKQKKKEKVKNKVNIIKFYKALQKIC